MMSTALDLTEIAQACGCMKEKDSAKVSSPVALVEYEVHLLERARGIDRQLFLLLTPMHGVKQAPHTQRLAYVAQAHPKSSIIRTDSRVKPKHTPKSNRQVTMHTCKALPHSCESKEMHAAQAQTEDTLQVSLQAQTQTGSSGKAQNLCHMQRLTHADQVKHTIYVTPFM